MRHIIHYCGLLLTALALIFMGGAILTGPVTALVGGFGLESATARFFWYQFFLSLSVLLPAVLIAWFFRGRMLPPSHLSCDLVLLVLSAAGEFTLTHFILDEALYIEQSPITILAAACALFLALVISFSTTENGRHLLIDYLRIVVFLLSGVFFLTISLLLWPIFPRGDHFYYLCHHFWAPFTTWLINSPIITVGQENIDFKKPAIMVATHSSMLDIVAIVQAVPTQVPMLSKKSIFYVPLFGQLAALAGYVFIDRRHGQVAMEKLDRAVAKVVARNQWLAIFPEGTRTPEGFIKPLKKGAFAMAIKAGLPIVPVAIIGSGKVMPAHTWMVTPQTITMRFGTPIPTTGMTLDDRQQLQEKAQQALLELSEWELLEK